MYPNIIFVFKTILYYENKFILLTKSTFSDTDATGPKLICRDSRMLLC